MRLRAADARDLPLLEHAQQLHLRRQRHVADLVEEQRARVRELEAPDATLGRAGERALLVAEQLALEQRLRQRPAVHGDERLVAPRTEPMDRARDELLARAALALDEHRARHRRDLLDLHEHLADAPPTARSVPLGATAAADRAGGGSRRPPRRPRSASCRPRRSRSPRAARRSPDRARRRAPRRRRPPTASRARARRSAGRRARRSSR